jgi:hypothetical protein
MPKYNVHVKTDLAGKVTRNHVIVVAKKKAQAIRAGIQYFFDLMDAKIRASAQFEANAYRKREKLEIVSNNQKRRAERAARAS